MRKILLLLVAVVAVTTATAQPSKRKVTTSNAAARKNAAQTADRAALMFPTQAPMPEDVVWRRDFYRMLDLKKDANSPLYYPVEPMGRQVNLFTYLFRLMLTGRISAYTYKLDGVESFDAKDKMNVRDVLDRYSIYYEENNGKFTVEANDIPSAEVTRYYIKESDYMDQRTGTFSTKVTAICPVLMRGDSDFGGESTPYPLFWLNYDEIAPMLAKLPMMASDLNNVTNMTADDYFAMNLYKGEIYKTNNMQGRALATYCQTDSAMKSEQKRIEKQITDFEDKIWGHMSHEDSVKMLREDSLRRAKEGEKPRKSVFSARSTSTSSATTVRPARTTTSSSRPARTTSSSAPKAKAPKSSGGSTGGTISVRRQRR